MSGLGPLDLFALAWFAAMWVGYAFSADHSPARERSLSGAMGRRRRRWMREMLGRENRILDSNIIGNIVTGTAFFASTTILVVGGLFAMLGAAEEAVAVLADLPMLSATTRSAWELKVLLLIAIFVYAFFKLAWAFRLYSNASVLIGAAPAAPADDAQALACADTCARVLSLAAYHTNSGLRGYFFALAALGWFLHPGAFAVLATLVVAVLQRREFRSRSLEALRAGDAAA